jgi:membrane fusion protein, multidrug efflux system
VKILTFTQDDKTELDEGELLLIDNQIIQTTGTIRLRATFPNARRLLWPGELVNVRLLLRTEPDGLTIPPGAVQQGPKGAYVYVITSDQTVEMRPVNVAQIGDGEALIDSGLQPNDAVVVDGQYKLQPEAHVDILGDNARQQVKAESTVEKEIP